MRAARKALRGASERPGEGVPRWRGRSYLSVSVKTEKHTLAFSSGLLRSAANNFAVLPSEGGGNELLVTGTGSCSSVCVEQICTGHKSYKAQLSPPLLLLLLRFAARASQERLSAAAGDVSWNTFTEQPAADDAGWQAGH
ncbi:unnamed protein product [Pleuronectes platessa]|uniref:Uncharacterized protein n=1 Tax=Pleuronectes platessa TaxID=8262 RepID=A0A9N7UXN2_PLEPL|nr:unnamed protein product [Pleuronectes platessa]